MSRIERSYQRQANDELHESLPSRFTNPKSIDNWRHTRMLELARPLLHEFPGSTWMTVGDGRYGSDAAYLHAHGAKVLATSLTDHGLRHSKEQGFIPAYQVENAEALSLPDDSYDFVLCKEAYHHFPRPPVALYEMLRVARQAVVLIEPIDEPRLLDALKGAAKRLLRGELDQAFEPSGNYLYRIDLREMQKLLTAAGYEVMAYRLLNDFYHRAFETCSSRRLSGGLIVTRLGILTQDALSAVRLLGHALGCLVLFKAAPASGTRAVLQRGRFRVVELPKNPFA